MGWGEMARGCILGAALPWTVFHVGSTSDVLGPGLPDDGGVGLAGWGASIQRWAEEPAGLL